MLAAPTAIVGAMRLPGILSPLPCELYLWPRGRSYTGQPVAEIHTFGSPPLLEAVLKALCAAGGRPAEPGEFTLRAFLAGRIDLTQAEAVLGVIDAAGACQANVALRQLAGGLAGPLHRLRDALLDLLAHLEAGFDFADEDLPFLTPAQLQRQLGQSASTVARLERQMASRGESAEQLRVVLTGRPNTGKSSLFNALLGRVGALVSEHPGTTRDYLTAELSLDGVTCQLIDTAGVGEEMATAGVSQGPAADLQQAAAAVSAEQSRQAHTRILCLDSTRPPDARQCDEVAQAACGACIVIWTKVDAGEPGEFYPRFYPPAIATSSVTGQGIGELREAIRGAVLSTSLAGADVVPGTAVRCRHSLAASAACLKRARKLARQGHAEELVAAEIRTALEELGKVVGAVYTEDVLDRIFSRFCIGK